MLILTSFCYLSLFIVGGSIVMHAEGTPSGIYEALVAAYPPITGCAERNLESLPVYNESTWKTLQAAYYIARVVDLDDEEVEEDVGLVQPTVLPASKYLGPIVVKNSERHGRGVFATDFIPQGTLLMEASQYAEFWSATSWRSFLQLLAFDHGLVCDVIRWAYVEDYYEDQSVHVVGLDLGEGSLTNHGTAEEANVGCPPEIRELAELDDSHCGCDCVWALRDIQPGEEILADYDLFNADDVLDWFEIIKKEAYDGSRFVTADHVIDRKEDSASSEL